MLAAWCRPVVASTSTHPVRLSGALLPSVLQFLKDAGRTVT